MHTTGAKINPIGSDSCSRSSSQPLQPATYRIAMMMIVHILILMGCFAIIATVNVGLLIVIVGMSANVIMMIIH